MAKLISVIANLKDAKHFQDCFDSLLRQTIGFENIELILVNPNDEELPDRYENITLSQPDENIGHCHADYMMFCDVNVVFEDDALEFLYKNIKNGDFDMVQGGTDLKPLSIESIKENNDLLKLPPCINSKIFKKDFILKNDLKISTDFMNDDLIFNADSLINADGIRYCNKTISRRKAKLNEAELINFSNNLLKYHDMIREFDEGAMFDILENYWIREFCLSEISNTDKLDVLMSSKYLFRKYSQEERAPDERYEVFIDLINSKKYSQAVKLSNTLSLSFPEKREEVISIIKNQDLNFVFFDFRAQPGGTGIAVMRRANKLAEMGYRINLLSADRTIRNYKFIRKYLYDVGRLSRNVNVVNVYEYYSDKNTLSDEIKTSAVDEGYHIIKTENFDKSVTYEYYDKDDLNRKIKTEIFIDGAVVFRDDIINSRKDYFTLDGFNYVTRIEKDNEPKFFLRDRKNGSTIEFNIFNQLLCHFINEYTNTIDNRPFIICDNTKSNFNINRIDYRQSMKIGSLHIDPFLTDDDGKRVMDPKSTQFKKLDELKAMVILTEDLKSDLLDQFDYDNFVVIPNFIDDEKLEYEPVEKEFKIGIFSRISPQKNLSDAIKAFKIISDEYEDINLEIYGRIDSNNADEVEKLKDLASELDISDRIIYRGFLDDTTLEMKKCICSIMVSDYEGLPLSLLECMANSTAVVSYDTKYGPKDVITDGVDGYIVEHGDYKSVAMHVISLLADPQKAVEMGVNARDKIKNQFSSSVVCRQWEDLLADIYIKTQIEEAEQLIKERNYNKLERKHEKLRSRQEKLKEKNKKLKDKNRNLKDRNKGLKEKYEKIKDDKKALKKENNELKSFKKDVLESQSWKITKPLRYVKNGMRRK